MSVSKPLDIKFLSNLEPNKDSIRFKNETTTFERTEKRSVFINFLCRIVYWITCKHIARNDTLDKVTQYILKEANVFKAKTDGEQATLKKALENLYTVIKKNDGRYSKKIQALIQNLEKNKIPANVEELVVEPPKEIDVKVSQENEDIKEQSDLNQDHQSNALDQPPEEPPIGNPEEVKQWLPDILVLNPKEEIKKPLNHDNPPVIIEKPLEEDPIKKEILETFTPQMVNALGGIEKVLSIPIIENWNGVLDKTNMSAPVMRGISKQGPFLLFSYKMFLKKYDTVKIDYLVRTSKGWQGACFKGELNLGLGETSILEGSLEENYMLNRIARLMKGQPLGKLKNYPDVLLINPNREIPQPEDAYLKGDELTAYMKFETIFYEKKVKPNTTNLFLWDLNRTDDQNNKYLLEKFPNQFAEQQLEDAFLATYNLELFEKLNNAGIVLRDPFKDEQLRSVIYRKLLESFGRTPEYFSNTSEGRSQNFMLLIKTLSAMATAIDNDEIIRNEQHEINIFTLLKNLYKHKDLPQQRYDFICEYVELCFAEDVVPIIPFPNNEFALPTSKRLLIELMYIVKDDKLKNPTRLAAKSLLDHLINPFTKKLYDNLRAEDKDFPEILQKLEKMEVLNNQ